VDSGFWKRSRATNNPERDDDSKKSHLALGSSQALPAPEFNRERAFHQLNEFRDSTSHADLVPRTTRPSGKFSACDALQAKPAHGMSR
jgi:hypothetical protein